MNPKITNLMYALISISLLVAGIMSYQWVKDCPKINTYPTTLPSSSIVFIDRVIHCQSDIAHKEANE